MKKLLFLIILLSSIHSIAPAQYTDTVFQYFDKEWKQVDGKKEQYVYFRVARKTEENQWHVKDYYRDTKNLQSEGMCLDDSMTIQDGKWYYYYYNGKLKQECSYYKNNPVGLSRSYSIEGRLLDSSRYKSTGIPFHKSFRWDYEGRLVQYGEFNMSGSGVGRETTYYKDSSINATGKYAAGYVKDSMWTYYHRNGNLSYTETYKAGNLIAYQCYDTNGVLITTGCDSSTIFAEPGYNVYRFLGENTRMPPEALEDGSFGGTFVVIVGFYVDIDGKVIQPRIEVGSFDFFNRESLRVANKFPKFKQPRRAHNRFEKVYYSLPVRFQIK